MYLYYQDIYKLIHFFLILILENLIKRLLSRLIFYELYKND